MVQIPSDGSERTGAWFFAQSSLGSSHFAFRITFCFLGTQQRAKSPHRVAAASWTTLDFLQLADGGGGPDPVPSWAIASSGDPDPAPDHLVTGGPPLLMHIHSIRS